MYIHTKYIKLKTVRTFSPIFSNPLLTTVLNKRQLVRPLWRDNGKCGETFFSLVDVFVSRHLNPFTISETTSRIAMPFCLGLTGPNVISNDDDLPRVYCEVYRAIVGLNPCQAIPGGNMIREDSGVTGLGNIGNWAMSCAFQRTSESSAMT